MILSRSLYVEMPSWQRLTLRLKLTVWNLMGGNARTFGKKLALSLAPNNISQRRRIPKIIDAHRSEELERAQEICPSKAILRIHNSYRVKDISCIRCGLCFLVAPQALAPGDDLES